MNSLRWSLTGSAAAALVLLGVAGSFAFRQKEPPKPVVQAPARPGAKADAAGARADEQAIRKAGQAFSQAFNKGDLDAMMAAWAEDGELVRESGQVYRGKEAIRTLLKNSLATLKGHKHSTTASSVRFLSPGVAISEGTVTMTSPAGAADRGRYESVWVKKGGGWLLARVRDLPDGEDAGKPPAHTRLKPLAWLVGEWEEKGERENGIHLSCRWAPGETFLVANYSVKREGDRLVSVSWRIGWDPLESRIRSWTFDADGGFGGAYWNRLGNTWDLGCEGVQPDGKVVRSTDRVRFVDENTAVWSSRDRSADEQPLPDLEITFVRKTRK